MNRTGAAIVATGKEFLRTPVVLALLVFLPAYFVWLLGAVLPSTPVAVSLPGLTVETTLAHGVLPMLATLAAAMVVGITGLFLTVRSLDADGWLLLAGLPTRTLFFARTVVLTVAAVVASVAATVVLSVHVVPDQPALFVVAVLVLALTYGLAGAVVGVVLDRLAGVYVMLFAPAVDLFLFHSPLATETPEWAAVFPGRWAGVAATDAALTVDPNWGALAVGIGYAGVAAVTAAVAVRHAVKP
ncbi:hypothetical protein [Halolamina salina]|uniref:ABC transporter permease n=1 Tax=Halolamina salina TaxID=1220023 RepID=A0ABD6B650_9EURY